MRAGPGTDPGPGSDATGWRSVPFVPRLRVVDDTGHRLLPLRSLTGASDWRRGLIDRGGVALAALVGSDRLPAADGPAWPTATPTEIRDVLATLLPGIRIVGVAVPRQTGRRRLSLLARHTGRPVVAKLGTVDGALEREAQALTLLERDPLPGVETPTVLASGTVVLAGERLSVVVTTAIALTRQRPAVDEPLRTFESDLATRLDQLPHPSPTTGLTPVHGDLTPWNLRRTPRGLALFDWEDAGWGAPGSDLALYRSTSDEIRPVWSRPPRRGARW